MNNWFTVEDIDSDTFVISEYGHPEETHCYLLCGSEKCLLIDTGLGVGDISGIVGQLSDKPVIAAATHIHWDHIGGYGMFDTICAHSAELDWLNDGFPLPVGAVRRMLSEGDLPEDFKLDEYDVFQGVPSRILADGDKIELGGRTVEILHTPGHSPGHMCFWEERRGYLFTGDLIYKGRLYANYPSTNPAAYLRSVERISGIRAERIFPGHHSLDISPGLITEIRDALRRLNDEGMLRHGSGAHCFGGWSVLL